MGSALAPAVAAAWNRLNHVIVDEFDSYTDTQRWTKLAADTTATVAHEGTAGGKTRVKMYTDTTDNNECAMKLTNKMLKFTANKAITVGFLIQYAEAATNTANVAVGLVDAMGANTIADNGGAIAATDAALIYKKDGETLWSLHTEINGAGDSSAMGYSASGWNESASVTTAGGSSAQLLELEITPNGSTRLEVRPKVDGAYLKTSSGLWIMHPITLGTATDLTAGVYVKTGSGVAETVYVDAAYIAFTR